MTRSKTEMRPFHSPNPPIFRRGLPVSPKQLPAGAPKLFQIPRRPGLEVAADQRLGAAGPEGDPFAVGQQIFETIRGDELFHLERTNALHTRTEPGEQR